MKINVAKAKDLPPSWYELVLRPNKFAEHLEILRQNPDGKFMTRAVHLVPKCVQVGGGGGGGGVNTRNLTVFFFGSATFLHTPEEV